MRLVLVLIAGLLLSPGAWPATRAFAQPAAEEAGKLLVPPHGASSDPYRSAVSGQGLQNEIDYLPTGAAPDVPVEPPETERPPMNVAAWTIIALFLGVLLFLAVWHRRFLRELFGRRDRAISSPGTPAGADAARPAEIDHDLLARLRAETDPRVGLRIVLKRFLALAARENAIVLRRSLTTRELLRLLPGHWRHRGDLERLAERVELTVFGGREMSRGAYEECLDLAAPLLFRVEGA